MQLSVVVAVFPLIFLGELPDKTMFATLVLASRGRPLGVWLGAAAAFVVHVVIAVAAGAAIFALLPRRVVDAVVAVIFLAGAVYAYLIRDHEDGKTFARPVDSTWRAAAGAAAVIFVAEWGDLTQILTANLAARYHSPLSVGVASVAALWAVAAIAVVGGATLLRSLSVRLLRLSTAVVLLGLAAYSAAQAAR
jgi:putative Ca2+/H+ antiporter (TMEM165/GDT1 family)